MALEQTGRMNRSTDSRSDLYALGVVTVRNADWDPTLHGVRSDGMGALSHRQKACAAGRAFEARSGLCLRHHDEAARQDCRGTVPDSGGS
jgi:hypothetical protein